MSSKRMVLIGGASGSGKTASLSYMAEDKGIVYACTEAGKDLPFKADFEQVDITDAMDIYNLILEVEKDPDYHTIVLDTFTYLMQQYESQYVLTANDTRAAWGMYGQFAIKLFQEYFAKSSKNIIVLSHTLKEHNETEGVYEVAVPIKGAMKGLGVESYFSTVLSTEKMAIKDLKDYKNDMLVITPEEEALGYKHVFQTRLTKKTIGKRIRSPLGMWSQEETYIDNNVGHVIKRLNDYYA